MEIVNQNSVPSRSPISPLERSLLLQLYLHWGEKLNLARPRGNTTSAGAVEPEVASFSNLLNSLESLSVRIYCSLISTALSPSTWIITNSKNPLSPNAQKCLESKGSRRMHENNSRAEFHTSGDKQRLRFMEMDTTNCPIVLVEFVNKSPHPTIPKLDHTTGKTCMNPWILNMKTQVLHPITLSLEFRQHRHDSSLKTLRIALEHKANRITTFSITGKQITRPSIPQWIETSSNYRSTLQPH
ncbi:hypothetical protein NE237_017088 [Protea cynaroides]|uniref:Uncharacterized protein n=1 Tax=Protea cynaroides TaxID=273540 RepID=A0A9Q0K7D6_9MAGN|nr:hypothetical protein NE237_017088 [Protea cynaroides]